MLKMGITKEGKHRTLPIMNKTKDAEKEVGCIQFNAENMLFDVEQEEANKLLAHALLECKTQHKPSNIETVAEQTYQN